MVNIIAFLIIFAGVLLFAFSFVIKFKPINFEEEPEQETEDDSGCDDDFRALLDSGKAFIRFFAVFIVVVGIIVYIL